MMVIPIALISFLPYSTVLKAENDTAFIVQQNKKPITGVVVDAAGLPLIGVNVGVKGTTEGAITDLDGKFNLNVSPQSVLSISYIGYKTAEIPARENLRVVLEEDSQALDEVVVIGYGSIKKSDLTGSVANVSSEKILEKNSTNPLGALQGKVAGFTINNNSGLPGGNFKVNIRGYNSINATNDPLFVIDGVIGADFGMLNSSDIESVDVLKDASSTAIYGARGANGVILVTTKKGK